MLASAPFSSSKGTIASCTPLTAIDNGVSSELSLALTFAALSSNKCVLAISPLSLSHVVESFLILPLY